MKNLFRSFLIMALCLAVFAALSAPAHASWLDSLKSIFGGAQQQERVSTEPTPAKAPEQKPASTQAQTLTTLEMTGGIKDALIQAVNVTVSQLGRQDGFLGNDLVRIPMPQRLVQAEQLLRKMGQGYLADQFIESMNRAAETAIPKVTGIFADAISAMSIEDAAKILTGPQNAATEYFRDKTGQALFAQIQPIVQQATDKAQVTHYYKLMVDRTQAFSPLVASFTPDLDSFVTEKALDGFFVIMAVEEQKIRQDPVARGTDLIKKVFGNIGSILSK
ncbi:MAG: DUF4197 domain-containing protein [Desulfatibacillaceae bacterium]|nr:DUF4197 domain-containing protein [Desulfatibacillaceae bacterium]